MTTQLRPAPIVVGYDGSTGSESALRWATAEAVRPMAPRRLAEAFELVNGSAGQVLLRRSETADLLVVGTRGRGGFTGLLLGSVSQAALHHTHCPIAIVR